VSILFIFLDGIGLGDDNADSNPFAVADLPTLARFTDGRRWLRGLPRIESDSAVFIPTDATLGVAGRPQSATGQGAILTGRNVPRLLGYHYGPKPNPEIAAIIRRDNLFRWFVAQGLSARFLNAYPPSFFEAISSGKRLLAAIPLAVQSAGLPLPDREALCAGRALSADFTGEGWHTHLGDHGVPVHSLREAGHLMARLASEKDFAFFEHWPTDLVGHRGPMAEGIKLLERFDAVLTGVLESWNQDTNLIIITSDHGNLEDLSRRSHTQNLVPTLLIGRDWRAAAGGLHDLTGFVRGIRRFVSPELEMKP
jgi:2,3-bisphosphoglycerate-independent phosphoglycerate mutase